LVICAGRSAGAASSSRSTTRKPPPGMATASPILSARLSSAFTDAGLSITYRNWRVACVAGSNSTTRTLRMAFSAELASVAGLRSGLCTKAYSLPSCSAIASKPRF
jgi:hypothetical protein